LSHNSRLPFRGPQEWLAFNFHKEEGYRQAGYSTTKPEKTDTIWLTGKNIEYLEQLSLSFEVRYVQTPRSREI